MKKTSFVLFFLIMFCGLVHGQQKHQFSLVATGGRASFKMDDLRSLYSSLEVNLPFPLLTTDDFPAYFYHEFHALYSPVPKWKIGLSYGSTSTGGRVTYSDYSGAYYFDQRINCREYGLLFQYRIKKWKNFSLYPGLSLTKNYSQYELEELFRIFDQEELYEFSASAQGTGFKPYINFTWQFRFLELMADAGYLMKLGKGTPLKQETEELLLNGRGEEMKPNWSGYRLGLGLGVNLNKLF